MADTEVVNVLRYIVPSVIGRFETDDYTTACERAEQEHSFVYVRMGGAAKKADGVGRDVMIERDGTIPGERTCLTITVFMSLTATTESAFHEGTRRLLADVEQSVRANLPTVALGQPPVVVCFASLPDESPRAV